MTVLKLSELPVGIPAQLTGFDPKMDEKTKANLLSMGFLPGTTLSIERIAPFGGSIAIRLRGGLLALRKNLALMILISRPENDTKGSPHVPA